MSDTNRRREAPAQRYTARLIANVSPIHLQAIQTVAEVEQLSVSQVVRRAISLYFANLIAAEAAEIQKASQVKSEAPEWDLYAWCIGNA